MGILQNINDSNGASSTSGITATTCPPYPSPVTDGAPIAGGLTFTQLAHWITGISMAVGTLFSVGLILMHASHLSRRREQVKIMRVLGIIPSFTALSFGSTYLGVNAIELQGWLHVVESIALASFFQLICEYIRPLTSEGGEGYGLMNSFGQQQRQQQQGYGPANGFEPSRGYQQPGGYGQFQGEGKYEPPMIDDVRPTQQNQLMVFQYLPVAIFVAVLTDITQATGVYCLNDISIHFANLWLRIIQSISVILCFLTILRVAKKVNKTIPQHRLIIKLFSFKGLIFLEFLQTLIFGFAASKFTPTDTLAYTDLTASLPAILLNVEAVIFAIIFWFSYPYSAYMGKGMVRDGNGFVALLEAFNPISVVLDACKAWY